MSELQELASDRGLQEWELQPDRKVTMPVIDGEMVKAYVRV